MRIGASAGEIMNGVNASKDTNQCIDSFTRS